MDEFKHRASVKRLRLLDHQVDHLVKLLLVVVVIVGVHYGRLYLLHRDLHLKKEIRMVCGECGINMSTNRDTSR